MSYVAPKLKANRRIFVFVAVIVALLLFGPFLFAGFKLFFPGHHTPYVEISFQQLLNDVDAGRVHDMRIKGTEIYGTFNNGLGFQADVPTDPALIQRLYNKGVSITTQP